MKVCLNRGTCGGGLSLPEFVELAAGAGFGGADVDMAWAVEHGAAALRDLYAARGMAFGGWGVPFDWRSDSPAADGLSTLEKQARIAAEVGIDACATWLLPSSDIPLHMNWHFHVQRLSPIAKVLAGHGLRFGLEFVSPYHLRRKSKHEFVFTPMAVLELASDVGGQCGLLVDSFHLHAAGEPMSVLTQIPAERVVLVHLNDAPAGPLDSIQDGKRVLPGEGVIDLPGFLGGLAKIGYRGPVSLEVFSDTLRAMPAKQAAAKAWSATMATVSHLA
ncbi:MAG TPA: sugar phosphate isomerase/epimerase family protein [Tepidisphaeraceae bacterium]|nr:sugar phosphate isomerase/epimerase family protein [Tepidisphaeraceae bacterium]